jgi:hypothetical protein
VHKGVKKYLDCPCFGLRVQFHANRGEGVAGHAKQIVYRYNDNPVSDEGFVDWSGDKPLPTVNEVIERHGKQWKVVAIDNESSVADTHTITIHRIFLIGDN